MKILLPESEIRKVIKGVISEAGFDRKSLGGSGGSRISSNKDECEIKTKTTLPLSDDKRRIAEIPAVKSRFDKFRSELESYLKANGFPSAKIGDLGRSRALNAAADAGGNKARISGSLHGLSLAQDILIDVEFLGPAGTFKSKGFKAANAILAGNAKFVKAMNDFSKTQADLTWGGTWGGSKPENGFITGRGILEFHHFELRPDDIKKALVSSGYDKHIKALGFTVTDMLSSEKRSKLFKVLVGDECVDTSNVDAIAQKDKEDQQQKQTKQTSEA